MLVRLELSGSSLSAQVCSSEAATLPVLSHCVSPVYLIGFWNFNINNHKDNDIDRLSLYRCRLTYRCIVASIFVHPLRICRNITTVLRSAAQLEKNSIYSDCAAHCGRTFSFSVPLSLFLPPRLYNARNKLPWLKYNERNANE